MYKEIVESMKNGLSEGVFTSLLSVNDAIFPGSPYVEKWEEANKNSNTYINLLFGDTTLRVSKTVADVAMEMGDLAVIDLCHRIYNGREIKTSCDAASLVIGNDNFRMRIPNGYGDGYMKTAIVDVKEWNRHLLDYLQEISILSGEEVFIYDYDCEGGKPISVIPEGVYLIRHGVKQVVFVKVQ